MSTSLSTRLAAPMDARAIEDIYVHYLSRSTCTFQRDADGVAAREAWLASHGPRHPVIVCEESDVMVGWGCLSIFRDRWGYRHTVESSVYVHHAHHRKGVGDAIMVDLCERARALGHHTIIAGITAEQTASVKLHEKHGFHEVARLREVGNKFDRWLDVIFVQRMLDAATS